MQAIPLLPLSQVREQLAAPLIDRSPAWRALQPAFAEVALREPPLQAHERWVEHRLAGRRLRFAQPLTLTPYAATGPCSARCAFCSETLRLDSSSTQAARLRPGRHYFAQLRQMLLALQGLPLSYSLSGLEATDDADWLAELLDTLAQLQREGLGPQVQESVLYTNGRGLVGDAGATLRGRLRAFGLTRIEWSRHHHEADVNQRLMRFRAGLAVVDNAPVQAALRELALAHDTVLVCVAQQGGVESLAGLLAYLDWAQALGVQRVVVRELAALPTQGYADGGSRRYIEAHRVCVAGLATALQQRLGDALQPLRLTSGYYFCNAVWRLRGGPELVFEAADYAALQAHEDAERIYKLVFHANGALCAGWQPDRQVLWRASDA